MSPQNIFLELRYWKLTRSNLLRMVYWLWLRFHNVVQVCNILIVSSICSVPWRYTYYADLSLYKMSKTLCLDPRNWGFRFWKNRFCSFNRFEDFEHPHFNNLLIIYNIIMGKIKNHNPLYIYIATKSPN